MTKVGQRRYAEDPITQAMCLAWTFDQEEKVDLWHRDHPWIAKSPRPDELIERIRSGELVEAHNAGFEFNIWNIALRREFSEFDVEISLDQLRCSAAKASCLSLPRALDDAVNALDLPDKKLADGRRLINKLSKPMASRGGNYEIITPGDTHQKSCGKYLYASFPPGSEFNGTQDAKRLAEEILCLYPDGSVKEPGQSMQVVINRGTKTGCLLSLGGANYRVVKVPKLYQSEIVIPEYDTSKVRELQWCEEEAEHRANWRYCQQDVRAERGLSNYCPEMTERELDYWRMDFRMNQRGIMLDQAGAAKALAMAAEETKRLNGDLYGLAGIHAGSQRAQILKWSNVKLTELGQPKLENTKADTLSFALHGVPTKASDEAREAAKAASAAKWEPLGEEGAQVRQVLEICMEVNKTSVSKYKSMKNSVCEDGKLHDIMLYNGAARTGRWSGKGVQPHNFVRGWKADMDAAWQDIMHGDTELIGLVWDQPLAHLAKACRGALIASPGMELYAADFNAIEARKLAWLSGCASMLAKFVPGQDIYIDMAEAIYNRTLNKRDNPDERNLGKRAILGLGYAMGWEKFQFTVWNEEGIRLEDAFCKEVVRIYRKEKYPEVPALWKAANDAAITAVLGGGEHFCGGDECGIGSVSYFMSNDGNFLHCRLPSGRLLAYLYPKVRMRINYRFPAINERGSETQVTFPAKRNVPQHKVRWHAEKLAEKQRKRLVPNAEPTYFESPHLSFMGQSQITHRWQRLGTHGGSLVENFDQASSRDLLAEAMDRIDQLPEFGLLLSIHDEVIAEAAKGTCALKEFESLMAIPPKWASGMPITAEGWIGQRLRK